MTACSGMLRHVQQHVATMMRKQPLRCPHCVQEGEENASSDSGSSSGSEAGAAGAAGAAPGPETVDRPFRDIQGVSFRVQSLCKDLNIVVKGCKRALKPLVFTKFQDQKAVYIGLQFATLKVFEIQFLNRFPLGISRELPTGILRLCRNAT